MSLSVKDPEAYRLASAIAKETGETITKVVIDSLRQRHEQLEQQRRKATLEEILAIARKTSRLVRRPYLDHADLLYDPHGLPK
ncbi:MAG: type II toxin-antitoxin system VapB family antitoxin [Bryobacteraceae bacterium]|nr:type II toxin-antitoxin system VapB family antitoxin [Bryobacteraceae bacterium]